MGIRGLGAQHTELPAWDNDAGVSARRRSRAATPRPSKIQVQAATVRRDIPMTEPPHACPGSEHDAYHKARGRL